jgi:hypothetical protein
MNVQELLEAEYAKATAKVKSLEKEKEMSIYTLNNINKQLIDAKADQSELADALDLWIEQ